MPDAVDLGVKKNRKRAVDVLVFRALLPPKTHTQVLGPALRDLLLALKQPEHGETASTLRQTLRNARNLLGDMNELLRCDLDGMSFLVLFNP